VLGPTGTSLDDAGAGTDQLPKLPGHFVMRKRFSFSDLALGQMDIAQNLEKCLKIVFQVAIVSEPGLRLEVDADLNVVVLDAEGPGEAREAAKGEGRREGAPFGSFDPEGVDALGIQFSHRR
jgi:hypothetical protein